MWLFAGRQLCLHVEVLVDATHHRLLAMVQPAPVMDDGAGKPGYDKQGSSKSDVKVVMFHVVASSWI